MMPRLHIEPNTRFSRLLTLRIAAPKANGHIDWECICDCGKAVTATASALRSGKTKSCGCLRNDRIGALRRTHGFTSGGAPRPTYMSWNNMWTRCTNPKNRSFKDYGAKGVTICDRWKDFANFLSDMGIRPENKSLDRIDPFGNYEPSNCRWSTKIEQASNTRGHAAIRKLAAMQQAKGKP